MNFQIKGKKGFVLAWISCFAVLLILIILPLIGWAVSEFNWTARSYMSLQALNLADAGAELAIWEIVHNNAQFASWAGLNPHTLTIAPFKDNFDEDTGDVNISVQIISPYNYLITSTGFVPNSADEKVKKTVKVRVFPHPLFNNAAFGYDSVLVQGISRVDSYNSLLGPYTALTAGSNGDVGTNGTFTREGNSNIMGDVFIGPEGLASGNNPPYVAGDTYYFGNEVEPIDVPFDLNYFNTLPSSGTINLSSNDIFLVPSGDWRYESISLSSKASMTISPNTRMYINNNFTTSGQATVYSGAGVILYIGGNGSFDGGGIVNTSNLPSNLQIYGLGTGTTYSFAGNSDFYGVVYAQDSYINLSGTHSYFGAVAGKTVSLSGTGQLHYDEALSTNGPISGYDIAYWQED